jgi:hypothetical protein
MNMKRMAVDGVCLVVVSAAIVAGVVAWIGIGSGLISIDDQAFIEEGGAGGFFEQIDALPDLFGLMFMAAIVGVVCAMEFVFKELLRNRRRRWHRHITRQ